MSQRIEVAPERWAGWLARFVDEHPGAVAQVDGERTHVAWDGGSATAVAFAPDPFAVVLVRRAGYAVGVAEAGRLVTHKVGTRHIHGRTAAGGWSQQRYARRRAGQAAELVGAVATHVGELLAGREVRGLVVGGDRGMVAAVLEELGSSPISTLPRRELFDLGTPDLTVLRTAVARGRAVWVTLEQTDVHG